MRILATGTTGHVGGQLVRPLGYDEALRAALAKLGEAETRGTDALASSQGDREALALESREGLVAERRELAVSAPPAAVYRIFSGPAHRIARRAERAAGAA